MVENSKNIESADIPELFKEVEAAFFTLIKKNGLPIPDYPAKILRQMLNQILCVLFTVYTYTHNFSLLSGLKARLDLSIAETEK